MGAPKRMWTPEEEAALKAGVAKQGEGNWSSILKDPEFNTILCMRSNVDLKDKWRNMHALSNGRGSRKRSKPLPISNQQVSTPDDSSMVDIEVETADAMPLAIAAGSLQNVVPKKPFSRLDNLIIEAITNLKKPRGSSRAAIAMYIQEQYAAPTNFKRLLVTNLELMTENGRLMKVRHRYKIVPTPTTIDFPRDPSPLPLEEKKNYSSTLQNDSKFLANKAQIDAELEKMKKMTAKEAAAAAAQAVAEAEAAIKEAEEAEKEAEAAEAEAEAARCFAEAARKASKCGSLYGGNFSKNVRIVEIGG